MFSDEEYYALLAQCNALVRASGSPTYGGAVGHVAQMRRALKDLLDGQTAADIHAHTGLPMRRCEELANLHRRFTHYPEPPA